MVSKRRRVKGKGSRLKREPKLLGVSTHVIEISEEKLQSINITRSTTMSAQHKELGWKIKKNLFRLSGPEVYQVAKAIDAEYPGVDQLDPTDEESCINHILDFMHCRALLESEDEGMGHLLSLSDLVMSIISQRDVVAVPVLDVESVPLTSRSATQTTHSGQVTTQSQHISLPTHTPPLSLNLPSVTQPYSLTPPCNLQTYYYNAPTNTQTHNLNPPTTMQPHTNSPFISLQDLAYFQRKEFRIHGGQIGDTTSDITYNSICKQVEEGLTEKHTEGEIIRGVLRVIKPGNFRDMLINKDDLTVVELKSFLQSHLGERSGTELFQDLMCAKQYENETPQQFLYRMIGLKQKIMFTAKQTTSVVKYDASTIQCIFLNTICQGMGERHKDVRRELKPLLGDPTVSDEALLRQVIKTTTEESERKRRLSCSSVSRSSKVTQAHSTHAVPEEKPQGGMKVNSVTKDDTIQRLSTQVEALTQAMEALKQQLLAPAHTTDKPKIERKTPFGCQHCVTQAIPNCNHCFTYGEEDHRAVGCLKKPKAPGNGPRSGQRGNP